MTSWWHLICVISTHALGSPDPPIASSEGDDDGTFGLLCCFIRVPAREAGCGSFTDSTACRQRRMQRITAL